MKYPEEMYIGNQIFEGDRDGSESNFSEKIVKTKKNHNCCVCEKEIPSGTKVSKKSLYSEFFSSSGESSVYLILQHWWHPLQKDGVLIIANCFLTSAWALAKNSR